MCGLIETDLQKNYEVFVKDHYSKEYFTGDPSRSAYIDYANDKAMITKNLKKYLQQIITIKPKGKVLDVGCAMGFFVELARNAGYDAYGFDPSEYAVEKAQKLVGKTKIKHGTISSITYSKKVFDVMTLFDVFEHLADPAGDIAKLSTYLKDDGIMVIATGDTQSVAAKVLKRHWTFYIPPQHLFFFNRSTLTSVLAMAGLFPVEWFRIGKWLSLRYILHLAKTAGESRLGWLLEKVALKYHFGTVSLYVPLRDNMVVIAQKKKI